MMRILPVVNKEYKKFEMLHKEKQVFWNKLKSFFKKSTDSYEEIFAIAPSFNTAFHGLDVLIFLASNNKEFLII